MDPIFTIAEAAKLIAAKQLSPVELTKDCIARMKAYDDTLHAFIFSQVS
jgi:aspartyl-tRNA(Asn)/glutamyl-tRNA(Gln) amidotransferase subunit A